ncbi:MAG: pilus assembly protein [Devosia sp. 67-54]|uniref:Flp family type IVb pilin n=1 Tax=unclassified Devosia TaxID=196773 RepID=UPI000960DB39|nr:MULTISPECIES: Flp family type IVb pilin [unclassified Devosia]MBN9307316.1 Flp family type IVb pilin [Devosia sp.]OJX19768.1 MAG: pilus assembly protein [Devosia sp. 67-54]
MRSMLVRFVHDDRGATAIEYGLIAGLIAVALIVAMTTFGTSLRVLFSGVSDKSTSAIDAAGV